MSYTRVMTLTNATLSSYHMCTWNWWMGSCCHHTRVLLDGLIRSSLVQFEFIVEIINPWLSQKKGLEKVPIPFLPFRRCQNFTIAFPKWPSLAFGLWTEAVESRRGRHRPDLPTEAKCDPPPLRSSEKPTHSQIWGVSEAIPVRKEGFFCDGSLSDASDLGWFFRGDCFWTDLVEFGLEPTGRLCWWGTVARLSCARRGTGILISRLDSIWFGERDRPCWISLEGNRRNIKFCFFFWILLLRLRVLLIL